MSTENKIYLVVSSSGEYDDYRTINHEAYRDPIEAERQRDFLEKISKEVPPFPFPQYDEDNMYNLYMEDQITLEEWEIYDEWTDLRMEAQEFNNAWVEEIDLL